MCSKCKAEAPLKEVKRFSLLLTATEQILSNTQSAEIWICPKCKEERRLANTEITQNKLQEPYFLGVVPSPPERRDGMMDRTTYHNKIERWVWQFFRRVRGKNGTI